MLMRVCYDVILGLTTAHWSPTRINEVLVPAQKGLTQCDLPGPELPIVRTAQPLYFLLELRYKEGYFGHHSMVKIIARLVVIITG